MTWNTNKGEILERFFDKIEEVESGCWLWTASLTHGGYGRFRVGEKTVVAHKVSYLWFFGDIPEGLELDHLCMTTDCVNPDHVEPVTHQENLERGDSFLWQTWITHCPQGHEYREENIVREGNKRQCRECKKVRARVYYWRKKGCGVISVVEK